MRTRSRVSATSSWRRSFSLSSHRSCIEPPRVPEARANCGLIGTNIAGVAEEGSGVVLADGGQRRAEGGMEALDGPHRGLAQDALHLGPGRLDWFEVWRVAGEVEVGKAGGVEERAYGL